MKYLIIARGLNEPDNNTPADEIFARMIECEENEVAEKVKALETEMDEDYPYGTNLQAIPVDRITDAWEKVIEIW